MKKPDMLTSNRHIKSIFNGFELLYRDLIAFSFDAIFFLTKTFAER